MHENPLVRRQSVKGLPLINDMGRGGRHAFPKHNSNLICYLSHFSWKKWKNSDTNKKSHK